MDSVVLAEDAPRSALLSHREKTYSLSPVRREGMAGIQRSELMEFQDMKIEIGLGRESGALFLSAHGSAGVQPPRHCVA